MTNAELQAKLKEFPDATNIFVDGWPLDSDEFELDDDGDLHIGPIETDADDEEEFDDEDEDEQE